MSCLAPEEEADWLLKTFEKVYLVGGAMLVVLDLAPGMPLV
jgi:hypothetical protein